MADGGASGEPRVTSRSRVTARPIAMYLIVLVLVSLAGAGARPAAP